MNKYIGTKVVEAQSMSALEAVRKGYKVSDADADIDTAGYEVEYEGGYRSWSPAEPFEKAYVEDKELSISTTRDEPYQEHQLRVIDEFNELVIKQEALAKFTKSEFFETKVDLAEQKRLKHQEIVMQEYALILKDRIEHF